jgi:mRNA interferase MazF
MSTVVAGITTNLQRVATEPSQFLVDPTTPEGASSGLSAPSAVKCENLYTISQQRIVKTLGRLSDPLMAKLENCLKAALEIT